MDIQWTGWYLFYIQQSDSVFFYIYEYIGEKIWCYLYKGCRKKLSYCIFWYDLISFLWRLYFIKKIFRILYWPGHYRHCHIGYRAHRAFCMFRPCIADYRNYTLMHWHVAHWCIGMLRIDAFVWQICRFTYQQQAKWVSADCWWAWLILLFA